MMFKSVHENKFFYQSLQEDNFSENLWHFLEEFVTVFEPVYVCTKKLQKEQFTIGDFLSSWIELKMWISNVDNEMSKEMLSCMLNRQTLLVDNDLVKLHFIWTSGSITLELIPRISPQRTKLKLRYTYIKYFLYNI